MRLFEKARPSRNLGFRADLVVFGVVIVLLAGLGSSAAGPTALAASPPELWTKCPTGSGSGQCNIPRGVAADSKNGHVFVGDQNNLRVDEFSALGQFVKTWGWDVVESGPSNSGTGFETCVPEVGDVCKAGVGGSGAGQFSAPLGIAIDSTGSVYVVDFSNLRVEKFNSKGQFVLMFGGEVNKTKVEEGGASEEEKNICPFDPGDECKAGVEGTGDGQFGAWAVGSFIAITATDKVYVGDQERIQRFDTGGHQVESLALPGVTVQGLATDVVGNLYAIYEGKVHKLNPAGASLSPGTFEIPKKTPFEAPNVTAVAVDAAGNVYAFGPVLAESGARDPIVEFEPEGKVIEEFGKGDFSASIGLATNLCAESDVPGNVYVTNASSSAAFLRAYGTEPIGCSRVKTLPASNVNETTATLNGTVNPKGEAVVKCVFEYGTTTAYGQTAECVPTASEIGTGAEPVVVHADIDELQKGSIHHFRLAAKVGSETELGADEEFKTLGPPVVFDEHAADVAYSEATLEALVNPEGLATTYRFQYTTETNFEEHGFVGATSTPLIGVGKDRSEHQAIADLKGLEPGITYRWRILATNSSALTEGEAHSFATYRRPAIDSDFCANRAFRVADSASLADCRAYEMVSPVDKNGGNIVSALPGSADPGGYVQASPDGDSLTYTATSAFADSLNSYFLNQYLARRQEAGWSNQGIHPPVTGQKVDATDPGLLREFSAFSSDLCSAWLVDYQRPAPTADGQVGYRNLYRRNNCATGVTELEALTPMPPPLPAGTEEDYVDRNSVQGISADARHTIFAAGAKLTETAHAGTAAQVYDRFNGENHLVSILPSGNAAPEISQVGSSAGGNLDNAVSTDGSLVYWSSGKIYVRRYPEQGVVTDECSEQSKACTLPVSTSGAFFWGAAADGSKALYSEGNLDAGAADLYEFDLQKAEEEKEPRRHIAAQVKGVAGMSEDLTRIYFVSTAAMPEAGENSEGQEAQPGQPNLYLEQEGAVGFIGTLVAGDVGTAEPGAPVVAYHTVARLPYLRATRVTPDGARIAFQSRASLTGYDNRGEDGRPVVEVFSYEAGGGLLCVSCNPSGARPVSLEMREPYAGPKVGYPTGVPAAAWIPTWEQKLHASNVLSNTGDRIFFNSNDALLPRDSNGAQDIYEWEAGGEGSCDPKGAYYFPQNGGCVYLISSGKSPTESEFWEASPDGRDVFFTTEASLLPQDPGLIDLYDAREGGGFPQPIPKAPCEGEACQNPPAPPALPTPSSMAYSGPENPPGGKRSRCPKGKRKVRRAGKDRCVKKRVRKKSGQQRRTNRNWRAVR